MADDKRDPFSWHPEPELVGFRDEARSRPALERLGAAAWTACLDYLYREAMRRPVGPDSYPELRRRLFPERRAREGPAPGPATLGRGAGRVRRRLAPFQYNCQHPRSFSYFTPPPLPMSIVGELLGQWMNQGVDVWHAGPSAALVEEEVVRWLADARGLRARELRRAHLRAA